MAEQKVSAEKTSPRQGSLVGQIVLAFLAILGICLALWLIVRLQSLVVLIVISVVFSTGLAPVVVWLETRKLGRKRRSIPRAIAVFVVYIIAFVVFSGAVTLIVVPVVREIINFSQHLPDYLKSLETWLAGIHHRYPKVPDYASLVSRGQSQLSTAGSYLLGSVPAVFGFLGTFVGVFTVLVVTFYLLLTFEGIRESFLQMIPSSSEKKARETLSRMAGAMGGWLRGMLILSGIVGLSTSLVMFLLGVPYAAVIGVVGAIGELIPMVGPIAAAVPALLITALGPAHWKVAAALVFFILLSLVESNVLAPRIMQKQVGISPLTTIVALLAGAALLGVVGALLAVPVAAALQVLYYQVIAPAIKKSNKR